jgi:putative DNA modification/repair radical SAM protein
LRFFAKEANMEQSLMEKLTILADSAKYDVACTSSGSARSGRAGSLGSCYAPGCCHTFTADGRCVSLLKVLMTNCCSFDCSYCVNRRSNDVPRATFTPRELADLTIEFYRRNYIEGLFLSSAVLVNADYTTERMISCLELLRDEYHFRGYIHAKAIPGADPLLIRRLGLLADRLSVNVELPSEKNLSLLAPDKARHAIFAPMKQIAVAGEQNKQELILYKNAPKFAPAGQSTQMIVGASPESDYHILHLTEGLYQKYRLKRVFYSAYIPVASDSRLPSLDTKPPLLREHRLYQADWLLRFYRFRADEILDAEEPNFNPYLDPKCNWALHHYGLFPVDVNSAPFEMLLRVPGIGPTSAKRIRTARQVSILGLDELRRMGVVLKRAQYFIVCKGFAGAHAGGGSRGREQITRALIDPGVFNAGTEQLSLFSAPEVQRLAESGIAPRLAGQTVKEEAVRCLAKAL